MVSLFETTEGFMPDGFPRPGVPVFVEDRDMSLLVLPSLWAVWLAIVPGRARSPRTWKTYATGVLLWLRACAVRQWEYREPTEERIATFRDYLEAARDPKTGVRLYSRHTVNAYVGSVCRFYEWAGKRGFLQSPVLKEAVSRGEGRSKGLLAHLDPPNKIERNVLRLPDYDDDDQPPHYYSIEERVRFLAIATVRDRIIARWSLYTGIRIMENAALELSRIPKIGSYRPGKYCPMKLVITKGGRPRTIWVPSFIIDETWNYVKFERRRVEHAALKRGAIAKRSDALWLNQWGRPMTDEGIRERFHTTLKRASVNSGTFHGLRHTFAITMLDQLMRRLADPERGERRALLALKQLLGHRYLSSTEIYLDARNINLGDLLIDDLEVPQEVVEAA